MRAGYLVPLRKSKFSSRCYREGELYGPIGSIINYDIELKGKRLFPNQATVLM